jgi:hypothetical protein
LYTKLQDIMNDELKRNKKKEAVIDGFKILIPADV